MKPEVFTRFKVITTIPGFGSINYDNISNIDDLRKYVGLRNVDTLYYITILRENCVVNMDKKSEKISPYHQHKYIDGHPIIATETDAKLKLFLPKLMYPNDVKQYLIKKYGCYDEFDTQIDPKTPVFFNVFEHTSIGLRLSATVPAPRMKWHDVHCEPLSKKDIVVDKNLNQLWPVNTGKMPMELTQLFAQKTEKNK